HQHRILDLTLEHGAGGMAHRREDDAARVDDGAVEVEEDDWEAHRPDRSGVTLWRNRHTFGTGSPCTKPPCPGTLPGRVRSGHAKPPCPGTVTGRVRSGHGPNGHVFEPRRAGGRMGQYSTRSR